VCLISANNWGQLHKCMLKMETSLLRWEWVSHNLPFRAQCYWAVAKTLLLHTVQLFSFWMMCMECETIVTRQLLEHDIFNYISENIFSILVVLTHVMPFLYCMWPLISWAPSRVS
jgi:hypothetical protein